MGYMGFGMRKAVYKRKPKKVFEKAKTYNKKHRHSHLNPQDRDDREVYIHDYVKPAYKRWWFTVATLILLGGLGYLYYDLHIYQPQKRAEEIAAFEKEGLLDYLLDNKPAIDSLYLFADNVDGAVREVAHHWKSGIGLKLASKKDWTYFRPIYYAPSIQKDIEYRIEEGRLYHIIEDYKSEPLKSWVLELDLKNINELDQSFIDYLEISRAELDQLLRLVRNRAWEVDFTQRGTIIEFWKFDRQYMLYLADEHGRFPVHNKADKKELLPGVLWD